VATDGGTGQFRRAGSPGLVGKGARHDVGAEGIRLEELWGGRGGQGLSDEALRGGAHRARKSGSEGSEGPELEGS
jgi:hypothetical protein